MRFPLSRSSHWLLGLAATGVVGSACVAPPAAENPPTPLAPDATLLTVRVERGVELLKSLSARIVRHERDLAVARQRYAETLAALALD